MPLYILYANEKHAENINYYTLTSMRHSYTYMVQLHLRATITPTRYRFTYEVQLNLIGTATPTKYSYSYEVKLHLREPVNLKVR
jgi:hypothetical protein